MIDKGNGGKADASNAGINAARYPLVCIVDADSILERTSLRHVVLPLLTEPHAIAAGGCVRIVNGCEVRGGFLEKIGLPRKFLPLAQVVEYLRGFLFGRLGWAPMNAVPIVSGAFGVFRRQAVIDAGGYRSDTLGEDMELILRMHRLNRLAGRPYRIAFLVNPVCWTDAPESPGALRGQRIRWQRGLGESLMHNRGLLLHPRGGAGRLADVPVHGAVRTTGTAGGAEWLCVHDHRIRVRVHRRGAAFWSFMLLAISLGILLSISALLLEEISCHTYRRPGNLFVLVCMALAENFGYHQARAGVAARRLLPMGDRRAREVGCDEAECELAGPPAVAARSRWRKQKYLSHRQTCPLGGAPGSDPSPGQGVHHDQGSRALRTRAFRSRARRSARHRTFRLDQAAGRQSALRRAFRCGHRWRLRAGFRRAVRRRRVSTNGQRHEGAALLYQRSGASWNFVAPLGPVTTLSPSVRPGLAMKDGIAMVILEAARVFERAGSAWTQSPLHTSLQYGIQGTDIEIDSGRILAARLACENDAVVLTKENGTWGSEGALDGHANTCGDNPPLPFLDIQGELAVVFDAYGPDFQRPAARIFARRFSTWSPYVTFDGTVDQMRSARRQRWRARFSRSPVRASGAQPSISR